jgi:glycosyltransferase involved in cell wall biosynthesis
VFPSLYEGFGLPVLEAMSCGAPVIASRTSSIPEVLGEAGIQIDPQDPRAIAEAMQSVLESESLSQELRDKGLQRAKLFSWQETARRTRQAYDQAVAKKQALQSFSRNLKPRIAFFSPLPPQRSGISDYSAELLPHLANHFTIDVYVDGYKPAPFMAGDAVRFLSTSAHLELNSYFSTIFQMGNSMFHAYMYDIVLRHPGVTVLHDVNIHGLVHTLLADQGGHHRYVEELVYAHGENVRIGIDVLRNKEMDQAIPLNERVLSSSKAVIVHSQCARSEILENRSPAVAERVRQISHGMSLPELPGNTQKQHIKKTLSIPEDAIVIGVFGIMTEAKQLKRGLRAFQKLRGHKFYFIAVGEFWSSDYKKSIQDLCASLKLDGRTAFVGRVSLEDFYNYLFVTDIVLNLRYPTMGETSGAILRAMSCSLPTVVNDVATFSELPDDAVVKVKLGDAQDHELARALQSLADDARTRERLGAAARQHIRDHHAWEDVARQYAEFIHYVEESGLGDACVLREILARIPASTDADRISDLVDAFAANPGLGRVLWY